MNLLAIISLLCIVESNNNPNAIGDSLKAKGCLQLHKIYIKDHNRVYKTNFTHNDAFDPELSKLMTYNLVQHYLGRKDKYDPKKVAMLHNGGGNWRNADKEKQRKLNNYWAKVKRLIK